MDGDTAVINGAYMPIRAIGKGAFGDVYVGKDIRSGESVAIKMGNPNRRSVLGHEYAVYAALQASRRRPRVPRIHWFGAHGKYKEVMVMEHLGDSLEFLLTDRCRGKFSPKTAIMLGIQILDLLALLHCCGYIHRDVKPSNFLMGTGQNESNVYLIDLGLAKEFKVRVGSKGGSGATHIREITGKSLVGTARFSSSNTHKGIEQSRRDDLESLVYMLVYFVKGSLPWQKVNAQTTEEKYKLIGEIKEETSIRALCGGCPPPVASVLTYVRSLGFKEKPNYLYVRGLLVDWFRGQGFSYRQYDWER